MKPTGIAKRITRAIDDLQLDDPEDAFYQLCPAIEATATKQFGKGGKKSFRDLISSNMQLMTRVAFRGRAIAP